MSENKRFGVTDNTDNPYLCDWNVTDYNGAIVHMPMTSENMANEICDLLNTLHDEKEFWKSNCCSQSSFNSILLNELSIAQEQGYEVSDPFKKLMEKKGV